MIEKKLEDGAMVSMGVMGIYLDLDCIDECMVHSP